MQLKESFEHAYCHLATGGKTEWLGWAIGRQEQAIRCHLSQQSLWKLGEAIRLAAGKPERTQRIQSAIRGWIHQAGPAYRHTRLREVAAFIGSVANRYGVPLPLTRREIRDCWREAHEQWLAIRAAVQADLLTELPSGSAAPFFSFSDATTASASPCQSDSFTEAESVLSMSNPNKVSPRWLAPSGLWSMSPKPRFEDY